MSTFLKVQLLFVMILFGVVIYTYFLYNDVIRLEREVVTLKSSVARLEASSVIKELVCEASKPSVPPPPSPHTLTPIPEGDDIEDDDDSVTSNEIKDLLTNINEDTAAMAAAPEEPPAAAVTIPASPVDLAELSEQELLTYKYEDLRAYLKVKGITCKNGPKIDIVKRILEKAVTNQI
jgi:hypothetical protein